VADLAGIALISDGTTVWSGGQCVELTSTKTATTHIAARVKPKGAT